MNQNTRLFVALMAAIAVGLLVFSLLQLHVSDQVRFGAFAMTSILASTFRVRIPTLNGTYSVSFLVLLAGISELQFGEVLPIAVASATVQSYWNAAARPLPIQVVFNISNLMISVAGSYWLYSVHLWSSDWLFVSGGLAAVGFYVLNTGLTSIVLSLVHGRGVKEIWNHWSVYTLQYYLLGSTLSSAWTFCSRQFHWQHTSVIAMALYLLFRLLRCFISTQIMADARLRGDRSAA